MKTSISTLFTAILLCLISSSISAQETFGFFEWASSTGAQNDLIYENSSVTDSYGNVYVAGSTIGNDGDYDVLLVKYDRSGDELWSETWSGSSGGDDMASSLVLDSNENIILTGAEFVSESPVVDYDMILLKYDSAGNLVWQESFDGPAGSYDGGTDVDVDAQNNIYVSAGSFGLDGSTSTMSDFSIQKYSSTGSFGWETRFNSSDLMDIPAKIEISGSSVIVAGACQNSSTNWILYTLDLSASTGSISNVYFSGSTSSDINAVRDIKQDSNSNIYVVGGSQVSGQGYDITVTKLDDELDEVWSTQWNGSADLDDLGNGIELDGSGNVYITGYTTDSDGDKNFILSKLNSSGVEQWSEIWSTDDQGDVQGEKLVLDGSDLFICGDVFRDGNFDVFVSSYSTSGDSLWFNAYNNSNNLDDFSTNIGLKDGEIFVSGRSVKPDTTIEYLTIKYSPREVHIPSENFSTPSQVDFQINSGQLQNTSAEIDTTMKYFYNSGNPQFYTNDTLLSFVYANAPNDSLLDTLHRVDVSFYRSKKQEYTRIHGEKSNYYNTYYGFLDKPVLRNFAHDRVIHYDVYDNIEFVYTADEDGYSVYAVCMPGSDPDDIIFEYHGQNSLSIDGQGNLIIETVLGDFGQTEPEAYEMNSSTSALTQLGWSGTYQIQSNRVSIGTGSFDTNEILVLKWGAHSGSTQTRQGGDNMTWSTYIGGGGDYGYACDFDEDGNTYVAGTSTFAGYPTTPGAYQESNPSPGQSWSGVYSKFNEQRQLEYSTYFGGTETDEVRAVEVLNNKVFLTGYTFSSDFPIEVVPIAYNDPSPNGNADSYLAAFVRSTGQLSWSTYFGTDADDRGLSLTSSNGHIFLGGYGYEGLTVEDDGSAYYQPTFGGGYSDGYIAKFHVTGGLIWSTYFGGSDADYIWSLESDDSNGVYVLGSTESSDFDTEDDGGFFQSTLAGGSDSFVAYFDGSGQLDYSTYYGGTAADNGAQGDGITITDDFVCFTGNSLSGDLFTNSNLTGSYYEDGLIGANDAFLLALNRQDHSLALSTYLGGSSLDEAKAIGSDEEGNVYLTGITKSSDFPTQTLTGTFDQEFDGGGSALTGDVFISTFEKESLSLIWSTFIAGNDGDGAYSLSTFENERLLILGLSNSTNQAYPTVDFGADSYYQSLPNGDYSGFILTEFDINPNIILSDGDDADQAVSSSYYVYPNPSSSILTIASSRDYSESISYEIIDVNGKIIASENNIEIGGGNHYTLETNHLSRGVYVLRIDNSVQSKSVRFIKN